MEDDPKPWDPVFTRETQGRLQIGSVLGVVATWGVKSVDGSSFCKSDFSMEIKKIFKNKSPSPSPSCLSLSLHSFGFPSCYPSSSLSDSEAKRNIVISQD